MKSLLFILVPVLLLIGCGGGGGGGGDDTNVIPPNDEVGKSPDNDGDDGSINGSVCLDVESKKYCYPSVIEVNKGDTFSVTPLDEQIENLNLVSILTSDALFTREADGFYIQYPLGYNGDKSVIEVVNINTQQSVSIDVILNDSKLTVNPIKSLLQYNNKEVNLNWDPVLVNGAEVDANLHVQVTDKFGGISLESYPTVNTSFHYDIETDNTYIFQLEYDGVNSLPISFFPKEIGDATLKSIVDVDTLPDPSLVDDGALFESDGKLFTVVSDNGEKTFAPAHPFQAFENPPYFSLTSELQPNLKASTYSSRGYCSGDTVQNCINVIQDDLSLPKFEVGPNNGVFEIKLSFYGRAKVDTVTTINSEMNDGEPSELTASFGPLGFGKEFKAAVVKFPDGSGLEKLNKYLEGREIVASLVVGARGEVGVSGNGVNFGTSNNVYFSFSQGRGFDWTYAIPKIIDIGEESTLSADVLKPKFNGKYLQVDSENSVNFRGDVDVGVFAELDLLYDLAFSGELYGRGAADIQLFANPNKDNTEGRPIYLHTKKAELDLKAMAAGNVNFTKLFDTGFEKELYSKNVFALPDYQGRLIIDRYEVCNSFGRIPLSVPERAFYHVAYSILGGGDEYGVTMSTTLDFNLEHSPKFTIISEDYWGTDISGKLAYSDGFISDDNINASSSVVYVMELNDAGIFRKAFPISLEYIQNHSNRAPSNNHPAFCWGNKLDGDKMLFSMAVNMNDPIHIIPKTFSNHMLDMYPLSQDKNPYD